MLGDTVILEWLYAKNEKWLFFKKTNIFHKQIVDCLYVISNTTAIGHMKLFKLRKIRLKIQFLSHTSHISSTQQTYGGYGGHILDAQV